MLSLYARNSASMGRIDQPHAPKASGVIASIYLQFRGPVPIGPWPGVWGTTDLKHITDGWVA